MSAIQAKENNAATPLLEQRTISSPVSFSASEDGSFTFEGYASRFNEWATIGGKFREKVAPEAFNKTVQEADVRLLVNHDGLPLARTKSGTLTLEPDGVGLRSLAPNLDPSNPKVQEVSSVMGRGDADQMSFSFETLRDAWDQNPDDGGLPTRILQEVRLHDVSLVTYPAYEGTSASLRAEARAVMEAAGIEVPEEEEPELAGAIRALTDSPPDIWNELDPELVRAAYDTLSRFLGEAAEQEATPPEPVSSLSVDIAARRLAVTRNHLRLLGVAV